MRPRLLNLLLLTALALAAVRFQAFLREPPRRFAPGGASAPQPEQPLPAAPRPAGPEQPQGYDVIVARDLFSPERGVVPPAPPAPGQQPQKPQPPPKLTLYGVVILDGERFAYLHEGAQEARPRKVREGERFAGGTVVAVRSDGVTFLFGGSEISLPLRTPKEGVAQLPPAQPQQGAKEGVAPRPGPAAVPQRIPPLTTRQVPAVTTPRPSTPTPALRRFPAAGPAQEDTLIDEDLLPDEEIGEEELPDTGEEDEEE